MQATRAADMAGRAGWLGRDPAAHCGRCTMVQRRGAWRSNTQHPRCRGPRGPPSRRPAARRDSELDGAGWTTRTAISSLTRSRPESQAIGWPDTPGSLRVRPATGASVLPKPPSESERGRAAHLPRRDAAAPRTRRGGGAEPGRVDSSAAGRPAAAGGSGPTVARGTPQRGGRPPPQCPVRPPPSSAVPRRHWPTPPPTPRPTPPPPPPARGHPQPPPVESSLRTPAVFGRPVG